MPRLARSKCNGKLRPKLKTRTTLTLACLARSKEVGKTHVDYYREMVAGALAVSRLHTISAI